MISDSSPLIIFGKINKLELLCKIFGGLTISESVYDEAVTKGLNLNKPETILIKSFVEKKLIKVESLNEKGKERSSFLQNSHKLLHKGEADTIALALQKREKYLFIDEHAARKIAELYELLPLGSFAVLLLAYKKKIINESEIKKLAEKIVKSDFRIGAAVLNEFWKLFDELKRKNK